ncbi:MAG: diaminopimelate epimerase [Clostridia bacterium]
MRFTKMHGIGNDYIYINCFEQKIDNPEELAISMSHRQFGVGGDGIVLIMPSDCADVRMRMYNIDGSEGKMCGNASRCVGKFAFERGLVAKDVMTLETASGIKTLYLTVHDGDVSRVRVDMGTPVLSSRDIPLSFDGSNIDVPITTAFSCAPVTCVSMGNPHAVMFTDGIDALDLAKIGPMYEKNSLFPQGVNTEFVEVISDTELKMRVWERGSGETLACGTGACAIVVAAVLKGYAKRGQDVAVHLRGGELTIKWDENTVWMTGSATFVFDGELCDKE